MSEVTRLPAAQLESLIFEAIVASDTSEQNAASVARALTLAEIDGRKGHGLSRVPSYAAQARSGKVDGHATPQARRPRAGAVTVDAAYGFAYPAFDLAVHMLPAAAAEAGIAAAAITRSHHFGVAGQQVERLADAGLVAMVFGNTPKAIAPAGGRRAVFGTNPIAFAAPIPDADALVIDLAVSQVARGNILKAKQKGEPIPEGWALDSDGNPTTDAARALDGGTMTPMGGSKGAALALMVEVLATALTGAALASEASSFFEAEGDPPGVGQLMIAIDPMAFAGDDTFAERISALAASITEQDGARLPGSRRGQLRADADANGIDVDSALLEDVATIAGGS